MKKAKPIFMIFVVMLICCSYSFGQPSIAIGKGITSNAVPVTSGIISDRSGVYPAGDFSNAGVFPGGFVNDGAGVYPAGDFSNAKVYLGRIKSDFNVSLRKFQCFLISSCGMYPHGKADNSDGAKVYLDGVGRIVSLDNAD